MESVVRLEKDDDFASARGKLTVAGQRIALVIPSDCRAMNRALSFKLLRRWKEDAAADIAIVTRDGPMQRLAREHGFTTCPSIRNAQAHWRHQDAVRQASGYKAWYLRWRWPLVRVAALTAVIAAAVIALLVHALPVATVRLAPVTYPVSERIEVFADPSLSAVDYAGMSIPARVITARVEGNDRLPTSGKKEEKARGFVAFGNLSDFEVRLPKGTVVLTEDGRRYETVAATVVPAPRWSSARAEVIAVEAGPGGEAERLAINHVEGPLKASVAVLNEQPISIDKSREVPVVAAEDREKLRASLFDRLNRQAIAALNDQLKQYEILVPQSIKVEAVQEEFDHAVGDEVTTVSLQLGLQATATIFDQRHIGILARKARESGLEAGRQLEAEGLRVSSPTIIGFAGEAVKFAAHIDGVVKSPINEEEIRQLVIGRPADEAAVLLQEMLHLDRPPEVQIEPEWATRAFRVDLIVEEVRKGP